MSGDGGIVLPSEIPGLSGGNGGSDYLEGLSDFAQGILNQIPEEDRPVVAKYYKDWDGNVTKRFQSIHEEYKPYKELGEPEAIREALSYIQMLNDDPVAFINNVKEAMKEAGMSFENDDDDRSVLPEYEGLPQAVVDQIRSLQETVEGLTGKISTWEGTVQEQEEQAALDNLLSALHTEHGDFDDDYVLLQLARGYDPEDAVKAFQENIIQKYSSSPAAPRKPAPNLFTGASGSVPNQADTSKMSKAEKMAWAVQALQASNQDN